MRNEYAIQIILVAMILLVGAARAAEVTGVTPRLNVVFQNIRECSAAREDGMKKAEELCRKERHRGVDPKSVRAGACWYGNWGAQRTMKITFACE